MKAVKMNRLFAALLVAAMIVSGAPVQSAFASSASAALFEGCWRMAADPDASAELGVRLDFEEYLMIESGTVTPQELAKLGFDPMPATFTTDASGNATWTVTLSSRSQGTIVMSGTKTSATTMSGSLVWDRAGDVVRYAFTGAIYDAGSGE